MSITDLLRVTRGLAIPDASRFQRHLFITVIAGFWLAALAAMAQTEVDYYGPALFLVTLGLLNSAFLLISRRPAFSAAVSLIPITLVIVVSKFKFDMLWMTLSFFDVMIVDTDTVAFLLTILPKVRTALIVSVVVAIPL